MANDGFRGRLFTVRGHWWGIVDEEDGVETAAPLGEIATVETRRLTTMLMLCRYYWLAGILGSLTGPIIRSDKDRMIELIPGTSSHQAYKYQYDADAACFVKCIPDGVGKES